VSVRVPVEPGAGFIKVDAHPLGLGQRGRPQIDVDVIRDDGDVEAIATQAVAAHLRQEFRERSAGRRGGPRAQVGDHLGADLQPLGAQKILQEEHVALIGPVDPGRRFDAVAQAELRRVGLSRGAAPGPLGLVKMEAVRLTGGEFKEPLFCLALDPLRRRPAQDEVIRRVECADGFPCCGPVVKPDRRRLVVELHHLRVMLHLQDGGQFIAVALELNGPPHLAAGITAADIPRRAADGTDRRRGSA
jgi:hypothetical protein